MIARPHRDIKYQTMRELPGWKEFWRYPVSGRLSCDIGSQRALARREGRIWQQK